jgi:hypothetical protein
VSPWYEMVRRKQIDATAVPAGETYFGNRGALSFRGSTEHSHVRRRPAAA